MKMNVGTIDRSARIALGLGLIAWALFLGGPLWAWIGIIPLATGAVSFCPLYPLLGISTCAVKKTE
jgi:hypothetical protein